MKSKRIIFINIFIFLLINLFNFFIGGKEYIKENFFITLVFYSTFYLVNHIYFKFIGKYLSWEKNPYKTLFISIIGMIPLNMFVLFILNYFVLGNSFEEQFNEPFSFLTTIQYALILLLTLVISLLIIILYTFKKIEAEKLKAEKLKTQNEQAKFESLKAQLDPHFLFNNLNVLISIIEENPVKAEKFAMSLSEIYKYVLQQKDNKLVDLKDELDFSKKYLELLKARFEKALHYELPQNFITNKKIPPMSLQILLENIIKHNQIDEIHPLKINIEVNNEYLTVKNNKNPKNYDAKGKGLGLELIKKRLELLTKKPVIIENGDENFIVKIPLI